MLGCRQDQDKKTLDRAFAIHQEAMVVAEDTEQQLKAYTGQATTAPNPDSVRVWIAELEEWEKNVVEVSGYEHEHHHHHDGEHHHAPAPDVSAGEMLDIQREMRTRIEALRLRIQRQQ
jgi:hypothetical protein